MSGLSRDRHPDVGVRGESRDAADFPAGVYKTEVGRLAKLLWQMTLMGDPGKAVSEQHSRMRSPRVGDRVVVLDATYGAQPERLEKAVGYLIGRRDEWAETDEKWEASISDELDDQERPAQPAWYVQYGPDASDISRWTNCNIVSIERPS